MLIGEHGGDASLFRAALAIEVGLAKRIRLMA
jgi:hypothetical protein